MNITNRILILVGCLVLSAPALAEREGRHGNRVNDRNGLVATQAIEGLTRALRRLDLTEDQKTAIHENFQVMRGSLKPLIQEMHQSRQALSEQILSGTYDEGTVAEIAQAQGTLTTEITLLVSHTINETMALLDEDQRTQLQAMAESRKAHRAEVRDRVRAHREHRRASRSAEDDGNG